MFDEMVNLGAVILSTVCITLSAIKMGAPLWAIVLTDGFLIATLIWMIVTIIRDYREGYL